ncbi:hypothetical protein ACN24K_22435 [Streptomyces microflavus]
MTHSPPTRSTIGSRAASPRNSGPDGSRVQVNRSVDVARLIAATPLLPALPAPAVPPAA